MDSTEARLAALWRSAPPTSRQCHAAPWLAELRASHCTMGGAVRSNLHEVHRAWRPAFLSYQTMTFQVYSDRRPGRPLGGGSSGHPLINVYDSGPSDWPSNSSTTLIHEEMKLLVMEQLLLAKKSWIDPLEPCSASKTSSTLRFSKASVENQVHLIIHRAA